MSRTGTLLPRILVLIGLLAICGPALAAGLTHSQLAAIRSVSSAEVSPDGRFVAYVLDVPRAPGVDEDGPARRELHLLSIADGRDRTFVQGDLRVGQIAFTADGSQVTFTAKRGEDEHDTLWSIPVDGGEARQVLSFDTAVKSYSVSPDGKKLAFVAKQPVDEGREKAKEKGYKQEVFEEDWSPVRVWLTDFPSLQSEVPDPDAEKEEEEKEPEPLELEGAPFEVHWSADGKSLVVDLAPRPLIDDKYMLRKIHVVDPETGSSRGMLDNPGKLGRFRIAPDGKNVAMISAADPNDPKEGRLMVGPASGGTLRDLLPGLEGHVRTFAWKDAKTLMFIADIGEETELGEIAIDGGKSRTRLVSGGNGGQPLLTALSLSGDGQTAVFVGERPTHPPEVFVLDGKEAKRLTRHNRWLDNVDLAPQESVRYQARDGLELSGILIRPLDGRKKAPLILMVHGGPEAHDRNGWRTNYSRPGQVAAARGYAVFYPNYRGSTGRGRGLLSSLSQGDPAGKEFDDVVDGVELLRSPRGSRTRSASA